MRAEKASAPAREGKEAEGSPFSLSSATLAGTARWVFHIYFSRSKNPTQHTCFAHQSSRVFPWRSWLPGYLGQVWLGGRADEIPCLRCPSCLGARREGGKLKGSLSGPYLTQCP